MEHLLCLRISFAGVDRNFDLDLNDNDKLSIVYYPSKCIEEEYTSPITFRKLFNLIPDDIEVKSLSITLEWERERIKKLKEENKSLREEIDILTSAFRSVYRD